MRKIREFDCDIKANSREWLEEQYVTSRRGLKDISLECGVSEDSIRTRLKRFGIQLRNHKESLAIRNKKYPLVLTEEQINRANKAKRTGRIINCLFCQEEFYINKKSKRKFCSKSCRKNYLRENINRNQDWRDWPEYDEWRRLVYIRDGYRCKLCGSKRKINAHHILEGKDYPDRRFDTSNGITLCERHHIQIHSPNNKELLLQTPNIGGSLEEDNPEASIKEYLFSLIRSND